MFFLKHDSGIGGVLDNIGNSIREAKQVAKEIGAKFEVKSCFVALKHNWDSSSYIPLDKKNLKLLEQGKKPVEKKTKIRYRKTKWGKERVFEIPEKCRC